MRGSSSSTHPPTHPPTFLQALAQSDGKFKLMYAAGHMHVGGLSLELINAGTLCFGTSAHPLIHSSTYSIYPHTPPPPPPQLINAGTLCFGTSAHPLIYSSTYSIYPHTPPPPPPPQSIHPFTH